MHATYTKPNNIPLPITLIAIKRKINKINNKIKRINYFNIAKPYLSLYVLRSR